MATTTDQIPDNQFISAVLLSLADRFGTPLVRRWHTEDRERAESAILLERRWLTNENDVRECVMRVAEEVAGTDS